MTMFNFRIKNKETIEVKITSAEFQHTFKIEDDIKYYDKFFKVKEISYIVTDKSIEQVVICDETK